MKATHYGECQVCGHRQKLPNDSLSLHGYSVKAGFFEGTCMGAKQKPFELDKSLIDAAIKAAEERLATVKEAIDAQNNGTGPLVYEAYDSFARHQLLARRQVDVIEVFDDGRFTYLQPTTKKETIGRGLGMTKASTLDRLRKDKVWRLDGRAKQIAQYIAWQQQRIKDWAPKPLQPIEQ
jgi:hypothetical protein